MRLIRGFGKNYFTLAAIQAYASAMRLLQIIHQVAHVNLVSPIHVHSTLSPPAAVLTSSPTTTKHQGHLWPNTPSPSPLPRYSSPR